MAIASIIQSLVERHPVLETPFQLFHGLAHHPVLLVLLLLVVLMLTGKLDRYGIGGLFFGIPRLQRFWAGMAVGLLIQMLLVMAYQMPCIQTRPQGAVASDAQPVVHGEVAAQRQMAIQRPVLDYEDRGTQISILGGGAFALALLLYFLYGKWAMFRAQEVKENLASVAIFTGFVISTLPSVYLLSVHPGSLGARLDELNTYLHSSTIAGPVSFLVGFVLVFISPFLLFLMHLIQSRIRKLPAAVPLCVLLMAAAAAYFVLSAFSSIGASLVLAGTVGIAYWAGRNPYRCQLPDMRERYNQEKKISLRNVVDQRYRLDPWKLGQGNPDAAKPKYRDGTAMAHNPDEPFVILCTSGGGIKAAAWTVAALRVIHQRIPDFHRHLRIITGASGGMVGAGFYVDALSQAQAKGTSVDFAEMYDRATCDMLTPVVRQMTFGDLSWYLSPFGTPDNRGLALEKTWKGLPELEFKKLLRDECAGRVPSLVYSPMMVEDGRRLLISNLDLRASVSNRTFTIGTGSENRGLLSLSALEYRQIFSEQEMDRMRVSTAARLSASFPYVAPAVSLPTNPRRRVVDAGYYDNFGVNLAVDWIRTHRHWLKEHASRVIILQLRCSMQELQRQGRFEDVPNDSSLKSRLHSGCEWLTTPAEGVLSAFEAGMAFRNDELLESIGDVLASSQMPFSTMLLENAVEAPLSWRLTQEEKDKMAAEADSKSPLLEHLAEALRTPRVAKGDAADYVRRREDRGNRVQSAPSPEENT